MATKSTRPVAVGLCRCSTDQQDRSVAEQENAIRDWAKAEKVRLLKVFRDDGVSGMKLSRPGLDACLEFIDRSPDKGTVVLWSRDRLVRPEDPIDGLVMERQIRYSGWDLRYLTGSNSTGHPLVDAILGLVEHHASGEYLRKLARDSLRSLVERLKAGDVPGGKIPFGYSKAVFSAKGELLHVVPRREKHRKKQAERTRLVLGDPEEVATVQWTFEEFQKGWSSPADLAAQLNEKGSPRPTDLPWNGGSLRDMLRNPVYVGDVVWNQETSARCVRLLGGALSGDLATHDSQKTGKRTGWARNDPSDHIVLRDRHPAIVSRDLFEAVQEVFTARGARRYRSTRRSHPLGGLLVCGRCRSYMTSRTTRSKGRIYRYYECRSDSHTYRVRADRLEEAIRAELADHVEHDEWARSLREVEGRRLCNAFRVLLHKVSLHRSPGRPRKRRRGNTWRVRLTPSELLRPLVEPWTILLDP